MSASPHVLEDPPVAAGTGRFAIRGGFDLPPLWTLDEISGPIRVGSEEHKQLFCRMLLDTFNPYRPAVIAWPRLTEPELARLRSLPFWDMAIETEGNASLRMQAMSESCSDPIIREAIALNAYEEKRHKVVLHDMVSFYGIELAPEPAYLRPSDPQYFFLRTGIGECLDSFFAFGLFSLAKSSGFFPPALVEVFEPVIQEEARHIIFFANWQAFEAARCGPIGWARFRARWLRALLAQARSRLKVAKSVDKPRLASRDTAGYADQTNFTAASREKVGVAIKPRAFMDLCLAENDRRFAVYDPRLLRPTLMPALVRAARPFVGRPAAA
ncbi:MAG: ferritin-like domain-containing protein [Alphaproteobacteria bacterium]|nr:ferritin-like domain-containing protein [Alphaproteobacteria bacterium]